VSGYVLDETAGDELVIRWDDGGEIALPLPVDENARFLVREVADQLGIEVARRVSEGDSFEQASLEEQAKALAALERAPGGEAG
jgi:hypothetical protein